MYVLLLICLLLGGCASDFSNKTPVDGLLKYCNSYYVRGSWHYPQRYYEYDETGIASWYGPGFHGKPKPCGEKFNQNALTAAHKTLPLPSVARVTNLKNGKSVVVIVDDRGPFTYDGRIIDLSAQSAKVIGIYQDGLGTVRVQSLPEESKALCRYLVANGNNSGRSRCGRSWEQIYNQEISGYGSHLNATIVANKAEPLKSQKKADNLEKLMNAIEKDKPSNKIIPVNVQQWHINIGHVFTSQNNAKQLLNKVHTRYPGRIKAIQNHNGKKLYNVILGPFKDKLMLTKATNDLHKLGYKKIIPVKIAS